MIPICFPIREDELFQGWLCDLAEANNIEYKSFLRSYMGQRSNVSLCYGYNIDEVVRLNYGTNSFFPDMYEIIVNHTTFSVERLGLSVGFAAVIAETMMRKQRSKSPFRKKQEYRVCPFCAEEDIQKYSRSLIHVSHQISEVRVCYKHGYVFENEDIHNINVEMTIANFAHDLFKLSPDLTFENIATFVTDENINKAISDGYLSSEEAKRILKSIRLHKYMIVYGIIRFLAWLFSGKAETLIESVSKLIREPINNDLFIQIDSRYGIGKYTCKSCDKTFYMSDRAVNAGTVCPLCSNHMTKDEQMNRVLSRFRDGKYEYKDGMLIHSICGKGIKAKALFWLYDSDECKKCKVEDLSLLKSTFDETEYEFIGISAKGSRGNPRKFIVRHKLCGYKIELSCHNRKRFVENPNTVKCPKCDGIIRADIKRLRAIRVGERRTGTTGMGCEVIGYDGSLDVTVRFDNGLTRKMKWDSFKTIGTGKQTVLPELYIGLERKLKDGRTCKIIEYIGCNKLQIEFSDGEKQWTTWQSFKSSQFKTGSVDYKAYKGHIIQLYNGAVVNVFNNVSDAAKQLDVSTTTVKNYIKGITKIPGYEFKIDKGENYKAIQKPEHLKLKTLTSNRIKRSVNQYDLDGHYIKTYESVSDAKRAIGINPSNCLNSNGKIKTAGGFQWSYNTGEYIDIAPIRQERTCDKAVVQIRIHDKTVIAKYSTVSEASRTCGISRSMISLACRGKAKTAGGYIWRFDYDETKGK